MMTYAIVTIYIIWFAASIFWQFQYKSKTADQIKSYDILGMVPNWTFFAPNPGTSDYHLIYREQLEDKSITAWTEIPLTSRRLTLDWLWNPQKRKNKLLMDCVSSLAQVAMNMQQLKPQPENYNQLCLTIPYLLILNLVCNNKQILITSENTLYRQFAIIKTDGYFRKTQPQILIQSIYHPIKK